MEILLHKPEQPLIDFKVNILEKPFTASDGIVYPKTVQVDFMDAKGRKKETKDYGFLFADAVYEMIEREQPVCLHECYVKNFSLAEFRQQKSLPEQQPVTLKKFFAKGAFFDCDIAVDFSHSVFENSKITFEGSIFGNGNINFSHANFGDGAVSFRRTRFGEGTVDFRFAEFGAGNLSFRFSHFGTGDVFFVNTKFGGKETDFQSVTWGQGETDFRFAQFTQGSVSFEKCFFGNGKTDFKAVEFCGERVDFKRVDWGDGDVSFEGSEFNNAKVSFRSSVFGKGDLNFEEVEFGPNEVSFERTDFSSDKVSFYKSKVASITFQTSRLKAYFDFRFAQCTSLDLRDTILRDIIDLIPDGEVTPILIFNFSRMKNMGRINIDWKKNHVKNLIYKQTSTSLLEKAEQFRMLKEEFRAVGKYEDEDKAYVEFMRCESKSLLQAELKKNSSNALWAYPFYIFKWLVFDKMGQYATNPLRVITSMMVVYSLFSSLYYILPRIADAAMFSSYNFTDASSLLVAFYYSAITFFTVGFGDYYTTGWLRLVSITEAFMGVFMMSYFTVAFVRKILR
ncbi:MAG: two pore domain potassium channel family protein [Bacteroidetes bacterium]|nr:two pore domain potassium channel family protein [Bacteroidota bacterium]